jgi:hypothetical protein
MFVQLYPDPVCAPMRAHFLAAYRAATGEAPSEEAPRRAPAGVGPAATLAVA